MKTLIAMASAVVLACCALLAAYTASAADPKAAIEGVYVLDQWNSGGKILRPPEVEGRVVLLDGAIVVILIDTAPGSQSSYAVSYGTYVLGPDSFAYGFDGRAMFTENAGTIALSRAIPWQGEREFTLTHEGGTIHLDYQGKADFAFTPAGLIYSEGGKILRVYHRLARE
ncbi:MAG TPA: hypothetical protein VMF62_13265 [Acetobacteraceae bacterium]|nr:hypothetical protein [Acetobacteraceae bacterium]